jgi:hypothetical protein
LKRVVEARAFASTFDLLIFLNFILLCLPSADSVWAGQEMWRSMLGGVGVGLSLAMTAEQMLLALFHGWGLEKRPMLLADMGIVLLGFVESLSMWQPSSIMAMRLPRLIVRVALFRDLVPALAELEEVLLSYWFALKNSTGILLFLALWTIVFGFIGLGSFGGCKFARQGITAQSNFDKIGNTLELLFRMAVGGEYLHVMRAISVLRIYIYIY